jgi:GDP-D-mannose 3',5'-epimerase
MAEAARRAGVKRFFYSSSACIYPEFKQLDPANPGLKESDAWPANPQDAYGLEKLASEELCKYYGKDFGIEFRIGRFHNIYGPHGTWKVRITWHLAFGQTFGVCSSSSPIIFPYR